MTDELSTERAIEALYTVRAYYASLTAGYPKGKDCRGIGDVMCSEIANSCLMAIKALEQKPCEDAISREDAINVVHKYFVNYLKLNDDICLDGIRSLPSVTPKAKWIPVSERLPEDEQEILFSTKTGRVHSGKYHDDDSANQWYSHRDNCRAWNNVVIAWMPLPQPYKAESEDKG